MFFEGAFFIQYFGFVNDILINFSLVVSLVIGAFGRYNEKFAPKR